MAASVWNHSKYREKINSTRAKADAAGFQGKTFLLECGGITLVRALVILREVGLGVCLFLFRVGVDLGHCRRLPRVVVGTFLRQ